VRYDIIIKVGFTANYDTTNRPITYNQNFVLHT